MVWLVFISLFVIGFLSAYFQHLRLQAKYSTSDAQKYRCLWEKERDLRLAYQRGLGLPIVDQQDCQKALWSRAIQGDETSEFILQELLANDLPGRKTFY